MEIDLPTRAALEVAHAHGVATDRCQVLQRGSTLVLRLSETLVARVVTDRDGPRQGTAWFAREIAVAQHLARHRAPVIPLHPEMPAGPHEHLGFPLNFWEFVEVTPAPVDPREAGVALRRCHEVLRGFPEPLPVLAILTETQEMLDGAFLREAFPAATRRLLQDRLDGAARALAAFPRQPLHGDAHLGNALPTISGLLWTDWEDAFSGPIEWDIASAIWNARVLEDDTASVDALLAGYRGDALEINDEALRYSLVARAAVMSAWYPVLYPEPSAERRRKLAFRLEWLDNQG